MRAFASLCVTLLAWGNCVAAFGADTYVLQPGDTLTISVWKEPELTTDLLVRPDGGITMPLAGEIDAAGHSVEEVRTVIDQRLAHYLSKPVVTVIVKQTLGNQIFVIGKVTRPGPYPLNRPVDVLQALSLAGGVTPFASVNAILILRRDGARQITMRFRYSDIEHGRNLPQNILLQSGDTVVVP